MSSSHWTSGYDSAPRGLNEQGRGLAQGFSFPTPSIRDQNGPPSTVSEPTPAIGASSSSHPIFKPKRKRITPVQLETLAAAFAVSDTPLYDVREELATRLGMTNREVQVWFQNRRAKMARMRARTSVTDEAPSSHDEMQPEASTSNIRSNTSAGSQNGSIGNTYSTSQFQVSIQQPREEPTFSGGPLDNLQNVREVNTLLLPPSSASSFQPSQHAQDLKLDTLSQSSMPSRASATASWLHSIHSDSTYSYSPNSSISTLPSSDYTDSKASSDFGSSFLSVRSAPTRMQGSSPPGNYLFGPPPVLPAPATDFLNLSLQHSDKPHLPLPPPPTVVPQVNVPSESQQPNAHWYHAWPTSHTIAVPPHLAPRKSDDDQEQVRRW